MSKPFQERVIFFIGKPAGMRRADAQTLCQGAGARVARQLSSQVNTIVVGQGERLGKDWLGLTERFDEKTRAAFESGELEIFSETELWTYLGLSVEPRESEPLYTPVMLSELTGAPVQKIRQWRAAGLLKAERMIGELACFGFAEILAVQRILALTERGLSTERILAAVAEYEKRFPDCKRVLLQLTPMLDGRTILFRQDGALFDRFGNRCFELSETESEKTPAFPEENTDKNNPPDKKADENTAENRGETALPDALFAPNGSADARDPLFLTEEEKRLFQRHLGENVVALCESAWELEGAGEWDEAIRRYRAALLGGGADAGVSFQLAELLSRIGDDSAARERYYITLELEENHLEARAGLGRVLARLGDEENAVAVYQGALAIHPDYLEVRLELGRLLCRMERFAEAEEHLLYYRAAAPNAPQIDQVDLLLQEIRRAERTPKRH